MDCFGLAPATISPFMRYSTSLKNVIRTLLFSTLMTTTFVEGAILPIHHAQFPNREVFSVVTVTVTTTDVVGRSTMVATCNSVLNCVQAFCQGTSSLCVYWAGITGWDASKGVVPGMTVVPYAPCATTHEIAGDRHVHPTLTAIEATGTGIDILPTVMINMADYTDSYMLSMLSTRNASTVANYDYMTASAT